MIFGVAPAVGKIADLLIQVQWLIYLAIIVATGASAVKGLFGDQGSGRRAVNRVLVGILVLVLFAGMATFATVMRDTWNNLDDTPNGQTPVTIG